MVEKEGLADETLRDGSVLQRVQLSTTEDVKKLSAEIALHNEVRLSLLSETGVQQPNFRGLINLAFIALIVMELRLVVENLLKYGLLLEFPRLGEYRSWPTTWPCLTGALTIPLTFAVAFAIEQFSFWGLLSDSAALGLLAFNAVFTLVWPIVLINRSYASLGPAFILMFQCIICFLKLYSLTHVRCHYRSLARRAARTKKTDEETSSSITSVPAPRLSHLFYFYLAPTLCYQEWYPRSDNRSMARIVRRILEMLFTGVLIVFIWEQYVMTSLRNTIPLLEAERKDYIRLFERLLKMSVPNTTVWLLSFYFIFHSFLNLMAELLMFGDRLFYKDWWNAPTLGVYWRNWNLPVHQFLLRHIYAPALRAGLPPAASQGLVFLISAAFHELIICVPCHTIKLWAFSGMILQVPLIFLTRIIYKRLETPFWGNAAFWISFCTLGQPLCVLLYGYGYIKQHVPPHEFGEISM